MGKSTVSLALSVALARLGKKTLYISVSDQTFVSSLYARNPRIGYEEEKIDQNLWALAVDPQKSLHEYILRQIKFEFLYRIVFENRVMRYFLDATPGLQDLLVLGKITDMVEGKKRRAFDRVIVDMPATGHGFNLLRIPHVVKNMIPTGPLHNRADQMDRMLHNRNLVALAVVTLPEEMPVNESLELHASLKKDLDLPLNALVVNGMYPEVFSPESQKKWLLWKENSPSQLVHHMIGCGQSQAKRLAIQKQQLHRLREGLAGDENLQEVILPFIFDHEFNLDSIKTLAQSLLLQFEDSSFVSGETKVDHRAKKVG